MSFCARLKESAKFGLFPQDSVHGRPAAHSGFTAGSFGPFFFLLVIFFFFFGLVITFNDPTVTQGSALQNKERTGFQHLTGVNFKVSVGLGYMTPTVSVALFSPPEQASPHY